MFKTAKTKLLAFGAAVLLGASSAMAQIQIDTGTGVVSGSLETAPFMSVAGVVVIALGAMWAIRKAIGLFR